MKLFCVIVSLIHVSLQLKCDKSQVTAPVGGEILVSCSYNINKFLFSKKYWCRGSTRHSCETVAQSETVTKTPQRMTVLDARNRGLYIKLTGLRLEDTETYWVGIDKVYADIMTSVEVVVTEVPVSKPTLWPVTPLQDRPTCWGKAVAVRCSSDKGTNVRYEWYQQNHSEAKPVSESHDLSLHCGFFQTDACFYCVVSNNMGQQQSDPMYVRVLMPSQSNCIFAVQIQGQPIYDCADRLSTTTATTTLPSTASTIANYSSSSPHDQNCQNGSISTQTWTKFPAWYHFLRCGFLLFLLTFLLAAVRCAKRKRERMHAKRRRKTECS